MKKNGMTKILMAAGVAAVMMAGTALAGTWNFANGAWRYKDAQGNDVLNGWVQEKGTWYYVSPDADGKGALQTGWKEVNGKWYFLNPNDGDEMGAMITGWVQVDGVWYYLDPADGGAMAVNRDVNGYHLGADGAYTKKKSTSFRTASSPDDDDDENDDFPGDDDETEDNGWDASDASNGPGLQVAKDTTSGPGKGLGYAYSTKTASSTWTQTTTPDSGGRTFPTEYDDDDEDEDYDGDDYDDEDGEEDDEAGGSKEDFLRNQAAYYKQHEKVSTYEGDTGVNYEYNVTKITDADGETRTIVKKTKIEDEDDE